MPDSLTVWLRNEPVGELTDSPRGPTFRYLAETVQRMPGLPLLSTALPVREQHFDREATRNWFLGLLPEDQQRDEVVRRFNLQGAGYFAMLREIGWECAGAVVVVPHGSEPSRGGLQPLSPSSLGQRLAALPAHPLDGNDALRISLGGYQAKLLATRTADGWALPLGGAVSSHILKPQPAHQWPGIIAGEAWAMAVASAATGTAATELIDVAGGPLTLAVERFDREVVDGTLERLHQEDAAQALGISPEGKYARRTPSNADPTLRALAKILWTYGDDPRAEVRRLLEQVTVNVAVGNTDAHAKNYGILHPYPSGITLSPLYDVVPARIINTLTLDMGLRVGDTIRIDRVTAQKIVDEGSSWGLRPGSCATIVEETLQRLAAGTANATERLPGTPTAITDSVDATIAELLGQVSRVRI